jgi:hypothetical protein
MKGRRNLGIWQLVIAHRRYDVLCATMLSQRALQVHFMVPKSIGVDFV